MPDEIKYYAGFHAVATEYCCGLIEAGSLSLQPTRRGHVYQERWDRLAETPVEAWKKALTSMRQNREGYPLQMTLVVSNKDTEPLRQLINEQTDAFHVHTWTNPNSGNTLELYVLTNNSKVDE